MLIDETALARPFDLQLGPFPNLHSDIADLSLCRYPAQEYCCVAPAASMYDFETIGRSVLNSTFVFTASCGKLCVAVGAKQA